MLRFLFLFLASFLIVGAAMADTISIRADLWCPYNCAPSDKKVGYAMEVVKTILEKAGHQVDYQTLPWDQSIARTRSGDFVAIIGAAKEDAPDFVFPSEPIGLSSTSYATLAEKGLEVKAITDLGGKLLGVIQSYSYNPALDDYIAKNKGDPHKIVFASGDDALENNLERLQAGKADVVADDTNVLFYKTNKMGISEKLKIDKSVDKLSEIYIAFSPKNPKAKDYAALIDKGVADMRASGALKTVLRKYGLSDWK